jgi:Ca-activated chloride channel family protein
MIFTLAAFTCAAGVLWTLISETIVNVFFSSGFSSSVENVSFVGIYFALLALFSIGAALLSEHFFSSILVNKSFLKTAVTSSQLPLSLVISFFVLLAGSGILQFIYQVEPQKKEAKIIDDYYFIVDNTGSMEWNDPQNERIRFLSQFVNKLPETKKLALLSFNTETTVNIPLQFATQKTKAAVERLIATLHSDLATDVIGALETTATVLSGDSTRNGIVLFISDGASSEIFMDKLANLSAALSLYKVKKIPIHTIMLKDRASPPDEIEYGINLLKRISGSTGGIHSTVEDFSMVNMAIQSTLTIDTVRNLLTRRVNGEAAFPLYAILHVFFITLIGLLFGYIFYGVFSYIPIRKFLLLHSAISGFMAGMVLEILLQSGFLPVICRGISNILLSTIPLIGIQKTHIPAETGGLHLKQSAKNIAVVKNNKYDWLLKGKTDDNVKQYTLK